VLFVCELVHRVRSFICSSSASDFVFCSIFAMVKSIKYCWTVRNPARTVKARAQDVRVHLKNTRETGAACKGRTLRDAFRYLRDVIKRRQIVPFRRYKGGVSRNTQAKHFGAIQGRWPEKSAREVMKLLKNAESNAELKQLNVDKMVITHFAVQRSPPGRRRTYRAHGRINAYMSNPCHIELVAEEKDTLVPRAQAKTQSAPSKAVAKK